MFVDPCAPDAVQIPFTANGAFRTSLSLLDRFVNAARDDDGALLTTLDSARTTWPVFCFEVRAAAGSLFALGGGVTVTSGA